MNTILKKLAAFLLTATMSATAASTGVFAAGSDTQQSPEPETTAEVRSTSSAASTATNKEGAVPEIYTNGEQVETLYDYEKAYEKYGNPELLAEIRTAINSKASSVDLSKDKYFPEIDNQGSIGSCVQWSVCYYNLGYRINKMYDRAATKDNRLQPLFTHVFNCNEESMFSTGVPTYGTCPDTSNISTLTPEYEVWKDASNNRLRGYIMTRGPGDYRTRITSPDDPDLDLLKAMLRAHHPFSIAACISGFVTTDLKVSGKAGVNEGVVGQKAVRAVGGVRNHMMTIVGYDDNIWVDVNDNGTIDDGEMGAFKLANSWGKGSGTDGFFWIAYDAQNSVSVVEGAPVVKDRTSIILNPWDYIIDSNFKSSNIFLKYTLNSPSTSQIRIQVTAERKSDGVTFTKYISPFRSTYRLMPASVDGTMAADLNDIVAGLDSQTFNDYRWSVKLSDTTSDGNSLKVTDLSIVDENTKTTYAFDGFTATTVDGNSKEYKLKGYFDLLETYSTPRDYRVAGSKFRIKYKTENEGSTPANFEFTVKRGNEVVYTKKYDASTTDITSGSSTVTGYFTPKSKGDYTATMVATNNSGKKTSRTTNFTIYSPTLTVRSISFDKGNQIGQYDRVKISALATGGSAPYKYSFYYKKGGKEYTIAENQTSSSRYKKFGSNTGKYEIIVKVTDSKGKTATLSRSIRVNKTEVNLISFDNQNVKSGSAVKVYTKLKYGSELLTASCYEYTVAPKDGTAAKLTTAADGSASWTPSADGVYDVSVKVSYNGKELATGKTTYDVGDTTVPAGMKKINVNVISYVHTETANSSYTVHYWGGKDGAKNAVCNSLGTTVSASVGSAYWNGAAQKFYCYTAYIPADATGFKFHIGSRWFGGDGNATTQNTVYVFNYDGDKANYAA